MSLPFYPRTAPNADFVVFSGTHVPAHEKLLATGATAKPSKGYSLYVWNQRLSRVFLSGYGIVDNKLVIGPCKLSHHPQTLGPGCYSVVDCAAEDVARISADPSGMHPLYYSDIFITSSPHLAAMLADGLDTASAASCFYNTGGLSFSFNTLNTPFQGVRVSQLGMHFEIGPKGIKAFKSDELSSEPLHFSSYRSLIAEGAAQLVSDVNAIIDSGFPVFVDLSGGRDSRMVYAATVAAGKQWDVILNTIASDRTPGLAADFDIATGLASKYGGSYAERPMAEGYAKLSPTEQLLKRRSQVFGSYHWIVESDIRDVFAINKTPTIRMLGGGGEGLRDYYFTSGFQAMEPAAPFNLDALIDQLFNAADKNLGVKLWDQYRDRLVTTFSELSGPTMAERWDSHFRNFRLRYTFGLRQSTPESMLGINILINEPLLRASRGISFEDRASGRVVYDLLNYLVPGIAEDEFDSPNSPQIYRSTFHRGPQAPLARKLTPNRALVTENRDMRRTVRSASPDRENIDFDAVLDQEINESLVILRDFQNVFPFVDSKEMHNLIYWAQRHSPRNRSAMASKLRSLADYCELFFPA